MFYGFDPSTFGRFGAATIRMMSITIVATTLGSWATADDVWQSHLNSATTVSATANWPDVAPAIRRLCDTVPPGAIIVDPSATRYGRIQSGQRIEFEGEGQSIGSVLKETLQPLGLKTIVVGDTLYIGSDPAARIANGEPAYFWLNLDTAFMQKVDAVMDQKISVSYQLTPLPEIAAHLSEKFDLPIVIDAPALEELGLLPDGIAASMVRKQCTLESVFQIALEPNDLTLRPIVGALAITTIDRAEENCISRLYYLEGTGVTDVGQLMMTLQTSIEPDTWESLGGNSTMARTPQIRPGLIVTTTYAVHREIESVLDRMRAAHDGPEADPSAQVQPAARGVNGGGMF